MTRTHEEYAIHEERLVDFATRLVGERSPSGEEEGVARLVAAEMEGLGLEVDIDGLGNVSGTIEAGSGPCVIVDSHMDTVGVTDPDAWTHDPEGELVDGRLYGRGAMDMKGPLAASVHGIAGLIDRLRRGKIVVSATVAEELVEGPALVRVAERVDPDYAVICEATSLKLARGQRGRAEVKVEVSGRPTHSSRPELGVNAAQAMVDIVRALRDLRPPSHPVLGQGILVLTDIISRPYPGLSVVPDSCIATFDRRTLPGETEEDILFPVRQIVQGVLESTEAEGRAVIAEDDFCTYTGQRVRAPNFAPAWYFEDDAGIVQRALAGLERVGIPPNSLTTPFALTAAAPPGG